MNGKHPEIKKNFLKTMELSRPLVLFLQPETQYFTMTSINNSGSTGDISVDFNRKFLKISDPADEL